MPSLAENFAIERYGVSVSVRGASSGHVRAGQPCSWCPTLPCATAVVLCGRELTAPWCADVPAWQPWIAQVARLFVLSGPLRLVA